MTNTETAALKPLRFVSGDMVRHKDTGTIGEVTGSTSEIAWVIFVTNDPVECKHSELVFSRSTLSPEPVQDGSKYPYEERYAAITANPAQELHGPFGYLNGCRSLNEDSWELESNPDLNNKELFSLPLFTLTDPFKEIGVELRTKPVQDVTPVAIQRYDASNSCGEAFMLPHVNGDYVEFIDHAAAIAKLEARINTLWDDRAKLEAERDALQADLKHIRSMAGKSRGELEASLAEMQREKGSLEYRLDEMTSDRDQWQTALTACQKREAGLREHWQVLLDAINGSVKETDMPHRIVTKSGEVIEGRGAEIYYSTMQLMKRLALSALSKQGEQG